MFGTSFLSVRGDQLNAYGQGMSDASDTSYNNYYKMVAGEERFTCVELEVYKVVNY
jgi:hypothetical protein